MLVICTHCRRHYRQGESTCPFCGSEKPAVVRRFGVGAAMVALGVGATLGCGGETNENTLDSSGGSGSTQIAGGNGSTQAVGGSSSIQGSGGTMMTLYGGPPMSGGSS